METDSTPFNFNVSWGARKPGLSFSGMGSRTRKRFRDNRPDERVIHGMLLLPSEVCSIESNSLTSSIENTIHKLFSAQRNHPDASPIPSSFLPAPQQTTHAPSTQLPPQKSTLHSFWNIRAPPVQSPIFQLHQQVAPTSWNAPRCEECDAPLQAEADDALAVDMDVDMDAGDGVGRSGFACGECGKNVCGTCAVVGDARCCLQCATEGRRVGRGW
jgi:hypothetical protein